MTTANPVLVLSSSPHERSKSPAVFLSPGRKASLPTYSSSPTLLSPSAFIKPPLKGLKSGPTAAKIPTGTKAGFSSARKVWQEQKELIDEVQEDKVGGDGALDARDGSGEAAIGVGLRGKLMRPSKERKTAGSKKSQDVESVFEVEAEGVDVSNRLGRQANIEDGDAVRTAEASVSKTRKPAKAKSAARACKASSSKYFAEPQAGKAVTAPSPVEGAESSLEKTTRGNSSKTKPAPKNPKRLFKSASVILDSDDSDESFLPNIVPRNVFPVEKAEYQTSGPTPGNTSLPVAAQSREEKFETFLGAGKKAESQRVQLDKTPAEQQKSPVLPVNLEASLDSLAGRCKSPSPPLHDSFFDEDHVNPNDVERDPALRRRRSWTPVANSMTPASRPSGIPNGPDEVPTSGQVFSALLQDFSYAGESNTTPTTERGPTGEAIPKKRRIATSGKTPVRPRKPKSPTEKPEKPPKRPKAAKKRPQTITALVTAIYRPQAAAPVPDTPAISTFMTTSKVVESGDGASRSAAAVEGSEKPKPRMKRVRISDKEPGASSVAKRSVKAKPTKTKSKKVDEPESTLLTPTEARAHEENQEFLFGTSSQLAVEESTDYIRDLQSAIALSETIPTSNTELSNVPLQPMSRSTTSLKTGQRRRSLWATSARDEQGGLFECDDVKKVQEYAILSPDTPRVLPLIQEHSPPLFLEVHESSQTFDNAGQRPIPQSPNPMLTEHDNHDWALLSSDGPELVVKEKPAVGEICITPESDVRTSTSNEAAPFKDIERSRPALQKLDANASLHRKEQDITQKPASMARANATKDVTAENIDLTTTSPESAAPQLSTIAPALGNIKKRGRPRKASLMNENTRSATFAATRPSQVKWTHIDDIIDPEPHLTPSPPRRRRPQALASSPPPLPINLENPEPLLSPGIPSNPLPTARTTLSNDNDPHWPETAAKLFPQITQTLKTLPPSGSLKHPNWHEKILLYDPIELEDFTAWLNTQGLRIDVPHRIDPKKRSSGKKASKDGAGKPKGKRARKTKALSDDVASVGRSVDEGSALAQEPSLPLHEIVKHELKPWMVQKWCQEMSVCCLWKERMWSGGGVKNRY